ncbi:hypothetical protein [Aquipseudomonas campi]
MFFSSPATRRRKRQRKTQAQYGYENHAGLGEEWGCVIPDGMRIATVTMLGKTVAEKLCWTSLPGKPAVID